MTSLVHKSPLGPLEIPGVLGLVQPGEPFDVPPADAFRLLEQGDLFEIDGGVEKLTVEELSELAAHRGIDVPGGASKKKILAVLAGEEASE